MGTKKNALLLAAMTGLLSVSSCTTTVDAKISEVGKCSGVNTCKGHGDCAGMTNACNGQSGCSAKNTCAGKNSCKGTGFKKMTKEDCDLQKGKFEPIVKK